MLCASRRQRGSQHPREIGAQVRFRQQEHTGVETAMMDEGILGIAGGIEHLEPRASFQRLGRELAAIHSPREHHVGEQEIERLAAVDLGQRLAAVGGGDGSGACTSCLS